jgi:hypothetical protein
MKPGVFPDIPFPSPEFSQNPQKEPSKKVCGLTNPRPKFGSTKGEKGPKNGAITDQKFWPVTLPIVEALINLNFH